MIFAGLDFGKLEQTVIAHTYRGARADVLFVDDVYKVFLESKSQLEEKLDETIEQLWTWNNSKEFNDLLAAQKRKPNTKDLFKSKSTAHTFPWYHRNRKY